jgi:hypothetical protein
VKNKDAKEEITLFVSRDTSLPVKIIYKLTGASDAVVVRVRSFEAGITKGAKFAFKKSDYKGYEVIDFM